MTGPTPPIAVGVPPLSVYVHLPWCVRKCPYCDFNSHVCSGAVPQREYVGALFRDLATAAPEVGRRPVESIFFGGGTPSLFEGAAIAAILRSLEARLNVAPGAEVTLEANPGTVDARRFESFLKAGVNRLSLGAQSFDDDSLRALGRIHSSADIHSAWRSARAAGFSNINLDLMYGLPGQTVGRGQADVEMALELGPPHVSYYQLTLEPSTPFYRKPPPLPDEDTTAAIEAAGRRLLRGSGYRRYEVSAFARRGAEARHNLNYWRFGDYLGLGAGAHSKLTRDGRQRRVARLATPHRYMRHAGSPRALTGRRDLSDADLRFEFMLNRLRLTAPFTAGEFQQATGQPFAEIRACLESLASRGLMSHTRGGWTPSSRGRALLNEIIGEFVPEPGALYTARG